jgi:hypothetical protein
VETDGDGVVNGSTLTYVSFGVRFELKDTVASGEGPFYRPCLGAGRYINAR